MSGSGKLVFKIPLECRMCELCGRVGVCNEDLEKQSSRLVLCAQVWGVDDV